jgi:glycosyltransferase involved in cell wall biosynthesis
VTHPEGDHVPVTAIIASRNEGHLLARRLQELAFCDEVIVIDIDSEDETGAVAEAHGARLVRHPYVPIAEHARVTVAPQAQHDWLVLVDPDEEVPRALAEEAVAFLRDPPSDVAVVFAPIVYLFRGRRLRGTIWGGFSERPFLVRRSGVELASAVHRTLAVKSGYKALHLEPRGRNVILHHWSRGYGDWLAKHRRYVPLEGASRADAGLITGYRRVAATPWESFRESFIRARGYRDGARGFALSGLWALYSTAAQVAHLRELRRRARLQ